MKSITQALIASRNRLVTPQLSSKLAAAELPSFLKQTRAAAPWTERDLAKMLNIGVNDAFANWATRPLER